MGGSNLTPSLDEGLFGNGGVSKFYSQNHNTEGERVDQSAGVVAKWETICQATLKLRTGRDPTNYLISFKMRSRGILALPTTNVGLLSAAVKNRLEHAANQFQKPIKDQPLEGLSNP